MFDKILYTLGLSKKVRYKKSKKRTQKMIISENNVKSKSKSKSKSKRKKMRGG
tara:strand:- start:181 stop:339 length:159 start_codon:yes stop_codon:yes gene_type:complete